jgi:hypothetical protein
VYELVGWTERQRYRKYSVPTVENEDQTGPLEHDDLVAFILQRYVRLRRLEPLVRVFEMVHGYIELPKISVPKQLVVDQIELSSSMSKTVAVALSGEIHPSINQHNRAQSNVLWMTKLVALEIEVAFTT